MEEGEEAGGGRTRRGRRAELIPSELYHPEGRYENSEFPWTGGSPLPPLQFRIQFHMNRPPSHMNPPQGGLRPPQGGSVGPTQFTELVFSYSCIPLGELSSEDFNLFSFFSCCAPPGGGHIYRPGPIYIYINLNIYTSIYIYNTIHNTFWSFLLVPFKGPPRGRYRWGLLARRSPPGSPLDACLRYFIGDWTDNLGHRQDNTAGGRIRNNMRFRLLLKAE